MKEKAWLLAVAAPAEAGAVLRGLGMDETLRGEEWALHASEGWEVVVTGVGKVNAGGAVARVLDPGRHGAVLSVGVAGWLGEFHSPGAAGGERGPLSLVVAATACVYADEGLETGAGFLDCAAMGFPLGPFEGNAAPASPAVLRELRGVADLEGPVATVSTCSGTDALARRVVERTGALAEGMEGGAVAHVAARLGVPAGELRVVSNTCGDRPSQRWDLAGALSRLEVVIGALRRGRPRQSRGA